MKNGSRISIANPTAGPVNPNTTEDKDSLDPNTAANSVPITASAIKKQDRQQIYQSICLENRNLRRK